MIRTEPVETTETVDTPEPREQKLFSERVNETRHVRTFSLDELKTLLLGAVLNEALVGKYSWSRESSTIEILSKPGVPDQLTVKVVVPE